MNSEVRNILVIIHKVIAGGLPEGQEYVNALHEVLDQIDDKNAPNIFFSSLKSHLMPTTVSVDEKAAFVSGLIAGVALRSCSADELKPYRQHMADLYQEIFGGGK